MMRILFIVMLVSFIASGSFAQTGSIPSVDDLPKVIPASPNAMAMEKFIDVPVDFSSGVPSIQFPMWSWSRNSLSYSLGLSYHAGGNKVEEMASNVGQGWSLNGGGRVSRTVRGRPDDFPVYGYLYHTSWINLTTFYDENEYYHVDHFGSHDLGYQTALTNYNSSTYDNAKEIASGRLDGEQDLFSISFQGIQCRFVIDKNKNVVPLQKTNLKIEPVFSGYYISAFKVTDDKGLVYTFNILENQSTIPQSDAGAIPPPLSESYTSGWLISTVKDILTNESIVFNYNEVNPKSYQTGFSQMQTINFGILYMAFDNQTINRNWDAPVNTYSYLQIETDEPVLSGVVFPDGSNLNLSYDFSRLDYYNDNALSVVDIRNYENKQIKKFNLLYSYFNCPAEPLSMTSYNDFSKRLRLDIIKEFSSDNLSMKATSFEYNGTPMNRRDSRNLDHWGFNTSPLRNNLVYVPATPLQSKEFLLMPSFGTYLEGADKSADANYSKAGVLEKIVYPTGGFAQFDYEVNRAFSEVEYYEDKLFSTIPDWQINNFGNSYTLNLPNRSSNAVEFIFKTIEFDPRPEPDPNEPQICLGDGQDLQLARFEIFSTDYTFSEVIEKDYYQFLGGGSRLVIDLPFGKTYKIKFVYDAYSQCAFSYPFKAEVIASYYIPTTDKAVGGIRIKKIVHNDGVKDVLKKEYFYNNVDGNSSASLNIIPNYRYHKVAVDWYSSIADITEVGQPIYQIIRSSSPNYSLDFHNGSPLVYTKVIEKLSDNSITERYYDPIYTDFVQSNYPYLPIEQYPQLSGLLIKEVVKNSDGEALKEKMITYSKTIEMLSGSENDNYKSVKIATGLFQPNEGFATNVYRHKVGHAEETSRIEKNYANGVTLTNTTTTSYNSIHYPNSVSYSDSKNNTIKEEYTYSADKTGIPYNNMISLNMLNYVTNISKRKNDLTELNRKDINYSTFGTVIQPSSVQTSFLGNQVEENVVFNAYDDIGNILQYTGNNGIVTSFLWGYNKQYPVAKVEGKTYAEISAVLNGALLNQPASDAALRTELNKLRTQLSGNYFVNSYVYTPLVGVVSETDANGRTIYYEYDNFNRLILIRDNDNNILKKFCYNYFDQLEDCALAECVNTDADWQNSSSPLRCQTAANCSYTGYREQEQIDMNPCSPTTNQTRWIQADYNPGICATSPLINVHVNNVGEVQGYFVKYTNKSTQNIYTFPIETINGSSGCLPNGVYNIHIYKPEGFPFFILCTMGMFSQSGSSVTFNNVDISNTGLRNISLSLDF